VSVFNCGNFGSYGNSGNQSDRPRLAGGTIPFIRKYSTICPVMIIRVNPRDMDSQASVRTLGPELFVSQCAQWIEAYRAPRRNIASKQSDIAAKLSRVFSVNNLQSPELFIDFRPNKNAFGNFSEPFFFPLNLNPG
jgi:hypothetical protein